MSPTYDLTERTISDLRAQVISLRSDVGVRDMRVAELEAALRDSVEYADTLMEQGWGRKHEGEDSEEFNRLKAMLNE